MKGEVILTIRDHLDWPDSTAHQLLLHAKLNRYLAFVESGEIASDRRTPNYSVPLVEPVDLADSPGPLTKTLTASDINISGYPSGFSLLV